jgi:hypothetical protein
MIKQNDLYVLLYSKYSNSCNDLITQLKQYPLYFSHINLLCVDNEKIRTKIINSNLIKITFVPCLLIVSSNGVTKQYENTQLFDFISEIIETNTISQIQHNTAPQNTNNTQETNIQQNSKQQEIHENSKSKNTPQNDSPQNDTVSESNSPQETTSTTNVVELLDLDNIDIGENKVVSRINPTPSNTESSKNTSVSNVMQLAQQMQKSREQTQTIHK